MKLRRKPPPPPPAALDERHSEHILASLEEGVIAVDAAGRVILMNHAAEQLTGSSASNARGHSHTQVLAAAAWVSDLVDAVAGSDQGNLAAEGEIPGLWQKPVPIRASASPILDSQAHRVGTALILQDLTLQRGLETDVRRAQSLAHLGVLVAGLAHEIRNPLGGIRGAVQLLGAEIGPNPRASEYIDLVLREVDRLTRLLEQLLQLRSQGVPESHPVNVHQLIDHVVTLTEESAARQDARLHRFFDPSLPPVAGDADALTQVFLNLVQNALHAVAALPAGVARNVHVTTRLETDFHVTPSHRRGRGRLLRIEIEDNGAGVPEAVRANLFSPFVTSKPKGTGLGLAISHRIVTDHGGTIRVESAPGRTRFRVILPAWEGETTS